MKNIIIMGIGRAGKTTISNMIKDRFTNYNLIHSDSIKWAIIRGQDKENYYKNNIDKQSEFEHSDFFQKTLLHFFNSCIRNDINHHGYILESGQLHPQIVDEMVDHKNTIVVCLGHGNLSIDDIVELCLKHDKEKDWTYGLSKECLINHAKSWFTLNEKLKKECSEFKIKYYDTSKNRVETLNKIMEDIIKLI